jgi:alkanesulfonate monooxygenase SsuD/methylene tetrahydromethanopterin reductase-like flavin-dependent oxidoreductase (luciferase family)
MKFAVNVINFGAATTPEVLQGWARMAEESGYDAILMSDHVVGTPDVAARTRTSTIRWPRSPSWRARPGGWSWGPPCWSCPTATRC